MAMWRLYILGGLAGLALIVLLIVGAVVGCLKLYEKLCKKRKAVAPGSAQPPQQRAMSSRPSVIPSRSARPTPQVMSLTPSLPSHLVISPRVGMQTIATKSSIPVMPSPPVIPPAPQFRSPVPPDFTPPSDIEIHVPPFVMPAHPNPSIHLPPEPRRLAISSPPPMPVIPEPPTISIKPMTPPPEANFVPVSSK